MLKIARFRLLLLLVIVMTVLAACGETEEEMDPIDSENTEEQDLTEPNEEEDQDTDLDAEEPVVDEEPEEAADPNEPVTDGDNNNTEESDELTLTGTFGGLADLHTFELSSDELENGFAAFQFSDEEILKMLENLEYGTEITVSYIENENNQLFAEKVELK